MNPENLHRKLIDAARSRPVSDRIPLAFEKRIMARLGGAASADPWALWARSLWRGAMVCVGVAAVAGFWGLGQTGSSETPDLAAQIENSIYASATAGIEDLW